MLLLLFPNLDRLVFSFKFYVIKELLVIGTMVVIIVARVGCICGGVEVGKVMMG